MSAQTPTGPYDGPCLTCGRQVDDTEHPVCLSCRSRSRFLAIVNAAPLGNDIDGRDAWTLDEVLELIGLDTDLIRHEVEVRKQAAAARLATRESIRAGLRAHPPYTVRRPAELQEWIDSDIALSTWRSLHPHDTLRPPQG